MILVLVWVYLVLVSGCSPADPSGVEDMAAAPDLRGAQPAGLALASVSPQLGPSTGGVALTIRGAGFVAGMNFALDGVPLGEVTVLSPAVATAVLPPRPGAQGRVSLTARRGDSPPVSLAGAFEYFTQRLDFFTGVYPGSCVLQDFDADRRPDLFCIVRWDQPPTLALGKGDGTFLAPVELPSAPYAQVVEDLDGDGKIDLVTSGVSVWRGQGGGAFLPPMVVPGSQNFDVLHSGDFNGDGKLDLVAVRTTSTDSEVGVFLNRGAGAFLAPSSFSAGPYATTASGDLDGDGKLDLVIIAKVGIFTDEKIIRVRLGRGDGTFAPPSLITTAYAVGSVIVQDLNRDGKADLITRNSDSRDLSIFLSKGDGGFLPPVQLLTGSQVNAVTAGDLDRDGAVDLLAVGVISGGAEVSVMVMPGRGDGTFLPARSIPEEFVGTVSLVDVNQDGIVDLATSAPGLLHLRLGRGDGTFVPPPAPPRYAVGLALGSLVATDVSGDEKPDLIGVYAGGVGVLRNRGDGTFLPVQRISVGSIDSVAVRDMNGDGIVDLVTGSNAGVSLLLGQGDGTFASGITVDSGFASWVASADLDQDGIPDVVAGDRVLLGRGGGRFQRLENPDLNNNPVAVGDVDGDNILDLVSDGRLLRGQGDGTFRPALRVAAGSISTPAVIADVDGDGAADLVSKGDLLRGNGDGTFQPKQTICSSLCDTDTVADLNGDGKLDAIFVGSGGVSVALGKGGGSFAPLRHFHLGVWMAVADFDGDGKLDLAVTTGFDGVTVLRNTSL